MTPLPQTSPAASSSRPATATRPRVTPTNEATASQRARFFLQRGHRVEIYDDATKELLAGPFDPDQVMPTFIV